LLSLLSSTVFSAQIASSSFRGVRLSRTVS
jgi:hypothetical protein